jgi:hypothetical protein
LLPKVATVVYLKSLQTKHTMANLNYSSELLHQATGETYICTVSSRTKNTSAWIIDDRYVQMRIHHQSGEAETFEIDCKTKQIAEWTAAHLLNSARSPQTFLDATALLRL